MDALHDPREWLTGPVLEVAPRLLGAHVTTELPDGVVTVRLTEVEAYDGERDPGSHAFRGPTRRNAVMFGPAGHLYVYRHMGLHHCVNVVTGTPGRASAVLLRAGQVVEGVELARARRLRSGVVRADVDVARGPARLTVALGLDLSFDGDDVVDGAGRVRLEPGTPPAGVSTGPRVGVAGEGGDPLRYPWRFWATGDPTVSDFRAGARRRRGTAAAPDADVPGPRGTAH
ncbi:DNA-3-methyladenine glycosylase [Cellulomonas carbonis]|uniref:DNA-3-methyladenine glycosylase n=1 Tax=Cellulomonas carbonis TaxID=1386092 RepID=UPI000693A62E|nr:putative 3-methyladenine DNA glycosylase [Cellulomonas carbonis]